MSLTDGEEIHRTPLQIIAALGLSPAIDVEGLASRRQAFKSVHMGMQDLAVGALLDLLQDEIALKPPRTGHLGNWDDIAGGRAGAMDFNKAVCGRGFGYPLIYCFTQTEAEGSSNGDWVYLPGSLVSRGKREALPLFTWDGTSFTRRARDSALFCPFVQTEVDGAMLPLIELHWGRMQAIPGFGFRLEAAVIANRAPEVRQMLALLLEEASLAENPRGMFQNLISHAVAKDGKVLRCAIRKQGKGYWLEDCYYPTTEALVDHAMIPFRAVTKPREFFEAIAELPPLVPIISSSVLGRIFTALFMTHYPGINGAGARLARPFNLHLHWGARDMAGFPPRQKGYFVSRSRTRNLRLICSSLVAHFNEVNPICIVLLPASIFMLCPTSAHPRDSELLADLFRRVREVTKGCDTRQPHDMMVKIESVTHDWVAYRGDSLSSYFLQRFRARSGVLHCGDLPAESDPVEPEGFRAVTMREACMIVGALADAVRPLGVYQKEI
ncbi:MAG TPA: DUF6025 family protein, partial [Blastocatellia bacterium]